MHDRLKGKVAVITGGSTGIGLAMAKVFASEGAKVVITGRRPDALETAAKEIGHGAIGVAADSCRLADLDRVYARVRADYGKLDILVANAGGGSLLPLGQITEEQVDATFGSNVKGVIFTVQKALPLMTDGGSIILTGSSAGAGGTAAFSVYAASKAAVRSLARSWVLDLKGTGIRVNVLSPGPVHTPGLVGLVGGDEMTQQGFLEHFAALVPLGRVGKPEEIGRAALFLASDDSSFVSGAELFADGGIAQV